MSIFKKGLAYRYENWLTILTPGLNFIKVLRTAFPHTDPKSVNFQLCRQYLFTLLGSESRVLHSELLTELSSRFSSRDEFSRVETSSEGSDITEIFPKFEFRLVSSRSDPNFRKFSRIFCENRVGTSFRESGQVRKARTLPKYFRNSKKAYFRNSRKRKFRKKMSNAGPYLKA